jgi:hypothetical protein
MEKHPLHRGGGAGNEPLDRPHPRVGCTDSTLRTRLARAVKVSSGGDGLGTPPPREESQNDETPPHRWWGCGE